MAGGISLRRGLVVLQFVIAQLLVIGTLVVIKQMHYFRSQPMGFDKNAVGMIDLPSDSLDRLKYVYLKSELLRIPGVSAASYCMDAPASWSADVESIYFDNSPVKKDFTMNVQYGDSSYLSTFNIRLVAGRMYYGDDSVREALINETLVARLVCVRRLKRWGRRYRLRREMRIRSRLSESCMTSTWDH